MVETEWARVVRIAAVALFAVLASAACGSSSLVVSSGLPSEREAERVVSTVATAISWPRRTTSDDLVRAAVATPAGQDGRLAVVGAQKLAARELIDPFVRLVFRVQLEGSGSGLSSSRPLTACYTAAFNYYGVIGAPRRTACPPGAPAIVQAPATPEVGAVIPTDFETTLGSILEEQPPSPTIARVASAVRRALSEFDTPPNTRALPGPPAVDVSVKSGDIGVSLRGAAGACLFGARVKDEVTVWRPPPSVMRPGELSCDGSTALQRKGVRSSQ